MPFSTQHGTALAGPSAAVDLPQDLELVLGGEPPAPGPLDQLGVGRIPAYSGALGPVRLSFGHLPSSLRALWLSVCWSVTVSEEVGREVGAATRRHNVEPSITLAYHDEAIRLAQVLENRTAEGRPHNTVGILEWSRGEYAQALPHYERGLVIFRDLQDAANAGLMLNSVGITLKHLGQTAEARRRFEEAVSLHRETGQRQLEGHALAALGDISEELGETLAAVGYYERSLAIRRDIGDHRGRGIDSLQSRPEWRSRTARLGARDARFRDRPGMR